MSELVCAMRSLHALEMIVVAAKHVRRDSKMFQVSRPERAHPVGLGERPEGLRPRVMRHGIAALLDCGEYRHNRLHEFA
jgi:hypothetical protein